MAEVAGFLRCVSPLQSDLQVVVPKLSHNTYIQEVQSFIIQQLKEEQNRSDNNSQSVYYIKNQLNFHC